MAELQFETAEYSEAAPRCVSCKRPIDGRYWMSGANAFCADCHDAIEARLGRPPTVAQFGLGALYGLGAAIAGAVAWYAVRVATNTEFGLLAIGVAWGVAWAVKRGGGGGVPQQFLACGLTYLAVVASYLPYLYSPDGDAPSDRLVAAIAAILGALTFPLIPATSGDVLWFVIVGIALWSAFRRTARPKAVWTGPIERPGAVAAP